MSRFVLDLGNGVRKVDLLPLHHFGRAKYEALGRDYSSDFSLPSDEEVRGAAELVRSYNLDVQIVGWEAESQ